MVQVELPPLEPQGRVRQPASRGRDERTGRILKGLRHLQASGYARLFSGADAASATASPARSFLQPISPVSRRANECVEEADVEFLKLESNANAVRAHGARGGMFDEMVGQSTSEAFGIAGATKAFKELVSEVEEQLNGGVKAQTVVKRGESVSERVPPRGVRHYKVPLPGRPTEVTVNLIPNKGRSPAMWASTSDPRPDSDNHELQGKDDKVVYNHALSPDDDWGATVDRRHTAPNCRELFVTVEAQLGECEYNLSVTFGHAKVVLTRKELAAQVANLKRTWATRVQEFQRDPLAREEFDSRVTELRKVAAQKKRDFAHGSNFIKTNIGKTEDYTPRSKAVKLHKRALLNCAKREACSLRRIDHVEYGHRGATARRELQSSATAVYHTPVEVVQVPAISIE